MKTAIPTPRQLEYQDWELGMFLHFGLWSFYEREPKGKVQEMDPKMFNPTSLDCRQWAEVAKRAGMKYAIFGAKFHDGYCNWPTATTDFSVKSSPWKNGKGDVVREFTDAFRAAGIPVGLYYSPADWRCPFYEDEARYNDFFYAQMEELMTGYGKIDLLWFDGAFSTHGYDWPRITSMMLKHQPGILMNTGNPNVRHGGSEAGVAPWPIWNTVREYYEPSTSAMTPCEPRWLPVEVCSQTRQWAWFYHDFDVETVKETDELVGMYLYSVGRGTNLLLSVPPDRRGLLAEPDATRVLEFGEALKARFGTPSFSRQAPEIKDGVIVIDLPEEPVAHDIVIQERLDAGEHVSRYTLMVQPAGHTVAPVTVAEGYNIGHKLIVPIHNLRIKQLRLEIQAEGTPRISSIEVFGRPSKWA